MTYFFTEKILRLIGLSSKDSKFKFAYFAFINEFRFDVLGTNLLTITLAFSSKFNTNTILCVTSGLTQYIEILLSIVSN